MSQSDRWGGLRHLKDLIQWLALLNAQLGLDKRSFKQRHCSKEILSFMCPPIQPYKPWTASIFTKHLQSAFLQNLLDTASPWKGIIWFGWLALYAGLTCIDDMQISPVQFSPTNSINKVHPIMRIILERENVTLNMPTDWRWAVSSLWVRESEKRTKSISSLLTHWLLFFRLNAWSLTRNILARDNFLVNL